VLPADDDDHSPASFVRLALLVEGGLAAVAMVIGWLLGFDPWYGMHRGDYDAIAISRDVLWGVAATGPAAAILLIDSDRWKMFDDLKEQVSELLQKLLRGAALWQLLIVAIAAGIGEEVLFRGLIQAGLAQLLPSSFALVGSLLIASIVFGLCHYLSNTYLALATLAGIYFGLLMLASGSLLPAIIAHALYDFIARAYLLDDRET
jgi:hypothetical protein